MSDTLRRDIRSAFDARFEPSPGLGSRIFAALADAPQRRTAFPRWATAVAALVVLAVFAGAAVYLTPARYFVPGLNPTSVDALSMGPVFSGSDGWVIRRTIDLNQPGSTAIFYVTHDGGKTWSEKLTTTGSWYDMSFTPDGRAGVVWSVDETPRNCTPQVQGRSNSCTPPTERLTVFRTTDGGDQWVKQPSPPWAANGPTVGNSIYFSGMEGWALSPDNSNLRSPLSLYHTSDGGASWTRVGDFVPSIRPMGAIYGSGVYNLQFIDSLHGWFSAREPAETGHSGLMATSDGGVTWHEVQLTAPAGMAGAMVAGLPIVFPGDRAVLPIEMRAAGDNSSRSLLYLFSSSDGGYTWQNPVAMLPDSPGPVGRTPVMSILDPDHWWVSSQSQQGGDNVQAPPQLTFTTNGGRSFIQVHSPRIIQMRFVDANHGWAEAVAGPFNHNQLLRSDDGGRHWTELSVPS